MPPSTAVALITGASRGLGRGIAQHVARLGYSAAINYAGNRKGAQETVARCMENRVSNKQMFLPIQADVGLKKDRARLLERTLREFGRLDALINNAGIGPRARADMTETSEQSFDEVLNVNLRGAFFLTQAVVNHWLKNKTHSNANGGFKIVFISSISAMSVSTNRPEYCISKAGVGMMSQLWAARLAKEGIQVFELRPGIMATDMTSGVKEKYDKQLAEGLVPVGRWGTPDDVGRAVSAILSNQFPFSTGEVFYIDGGLHIHRF